MINNDVTKFYFLISSYLNAKRIDVYWITPSRFWNDYLIENGIIPDRILDLTRSDYRGFISPQKKDYSQYYISTNAIKLADRHLRERSKKSQEEYIQFCYHHISEFIKTNRIECVIGENTTCVELISANLIKGEGGSFFRYMTSRIPNNRTLIFDDCFERNIVDMNNSCVSEEIYKAFENFFDKNEKPAFFSSLSRRPRIRLKQVSNFLFHVFSKYERRNLTYPSVFSRLRLILKRQVFMTMNFLLIKWRYFDSIEKTRDVKYLLCTLHKQPESTVDVLGYPFYNQIETIKRISAILPQNYSLVVKEHSHALMERSISFYKKIKAIPGVIMVDPFIDSRDLILNSELLVSICGTSSLEARLLGKKSATLVPMYFNEPLDIPILSLHNYESKDDLMKILEAKPKTDAREKSLEYFHEIYRLSSPFIIGDFSRVSYLLDDSNVKIAADAFYKAINSVKKKD